MPESEIRTTTADWRGWTRIFLSAVPNRLSRSAVGSSFVDELTQQRATVSIKLIGPGFRQLLRKRVCLFPSLISFLQVAFDPTKCAEGLPIVHVEARRFLGLHSVPPLAGCNRVAAKIGICK